MHARAWLGVAVLFVLGASAMGAPDGATRNPAGPAVGPGKATRRFVSADHPAKPAARAPAGDEEAALPTARRNPTMEPRDQRDFFNRFHPNLGWTPGRVAVIRWRAIAQGVGPSEAEQEWLAHYGDWLAVWRNWFPGYETR
jgi:hypothetical protein